MYRRKPADSLALVDAPPPIFVITGQLSAGKSTVARALLDRCERGYHIDVDGIREMVTSGLASPPEWTDETSRQFELAIRASTALARVYADAGFAVAIEGGVDPELAEAALEEQGLLIGCSGSCSIRASRSPSNATAPARRSRSTPRSWRTPCARSMRTSRATRLAPAGT